MIGLVLFKLKSEENQLWDLQRIFQTASCQPCWENCGGFDHLKKHVSNHGNSTYSSTHMMSMILKFDESLKFDDIFWVVPTSQNASGK